MPHPPLPPCRQRVWTHGAAVLVLALWLLTMARMLAFWAHDPMLAYGNNFDQMYAMWLLRMAPDKLLSQGLPFEVTPHQPWRWFSSWRAKGNGCIPPAICFSSKDSAGWPILARGRIA